MRQLQFFLLYQGHNLSNALSLEPIKYRFCRRKDNDVSKTGQRPSRESKREKKGIADKKGTARVDKKELRAGKRRTRDERREREHLR